ncbi:MAG: hypothetical protein R3182_10420, partial [Draconibacterium sp.]|nr:hypothetical protein [Draconibacterium sp.]
MRQILPLLFLIIFLGILVGANIYLSRRFSLYFDVQSTRFLYIAFASITVFMIGGLVAFTNAKGNFANYAYSAAAITIGFMLYLLLSTLLVDLLSLFVKNHPKLTGV